MPSLPTVVSDRCTARQTVHPAEAEIRADGVALLYRNATVSQFVALIAAPIMAGAVWHMARPAVVLGWLALMVTITVVRMHMTVAFGHAKPGPAEIHVWRNRFILGVACSGATWGAAALFLMPDAGLGSQFVVVFTLAGMVAAAAPTQAPAPAAFNIFCVLTLTPLAILFLSRHDPTQTTLGVLIILYMLGMAGIARRVHASVCTTLELRQQNRAMVEVLTRANTEAEAINAKLETEVAEHRRTGRNLENSLSLLRATLESTNDGIVVFDLAGRITSHNERFLDIWRLPTRVLVNGEAEVLFNAMRTQLVDQEGFLVHSRELQASGDSESHDVIELTDGRVFERFSMPQRIAGAVVGRVYSYRDVSEQRRAEQNLQFIANHDALTRLPNRSLFARSLAESLARARRNEGRLAVLFIDLDRFKNINDTLGHDVGDRLLCEVAARLCTCLRETDAVARLGGDEFIVRLEDVHGVIPAAQVAQRIIDALAQPHTLDGRECHVTASIGISSYPEDGTDADALLRHADIAMYRAKNTGKNTFEFYTDQLNVHTMERLALEASLRRALERDELVLHYQPKVDLETRRIVGVEALIRWRHPELGFVPPNAFIPLAEETGQIVPIGDWVLRTACAQAQSWTAGGLVPMRMAVNISPRQFLRDDLLQRIDRILEETGLAPDLLDVELTESMTMHNVDRALDIMVALKSRGIQLAIDDFGTGYSSLGYLKRFPIDSVKIDRSFVRDVPHARGDCALTQAAIAMAHALGMRTVAEGVETAEQLAFLQQHGCDEVQGYFFAKPMPAEDIPRFVRDHSCTLERRIGQAA